MSMKNSNDTIGNRTRDLPACSAMPQPTALPRAPLFYVGVQFVCLKRRTWFEGVFEYNPVDYVPCTELVT
jgi:hypothetical protein